tara:strand:+ start:123 stop:479 length:357 start_codon:yes stop_codon:yes gene_type:complete
MGIASSLKKVANKTIAKFGGDITIQRTTVSTYDTDNGTVVKNKSSVTVKGFIEGVSQTEVNDLISQNDKKLIISAKDLTFVPTTKDMVLIASIEYKILQIDKDTVENSDVKYLLYLRG